MPEEQNEQTQAQTILGGTDNGVVTERVETDNGSGGGETSAAATQEAFDFSTIVDSKGFFADNWKDSLPEDLRNEPCLENVKNFATLTKSFVNAQKMIGKNKIAIPGENASDEEKAAFYTALGRPEKAEDYKSDGVELPEGITLDDNLVGEFRKFAFENGVSQELFQKALAFDAMRAERAAREAVAAHNKEYNTTLAKLKEQYGEDLPARIAQVDKAMTTFGIKEIFIEKGLTNNYQIFEALANIGAAISESKLKGGENPPKFTSPKQQIDEIYADPNGPIYNVDHPAHERTVAQVRSLMAQMNAKN